VKISIERDAFFAQLQTVARVAQPAARSRRSSDVQIVAFLDACGLLGPTLDVILRLPLPSIWRVSALVVASARLLLDVARSLPAPQFSSRRVRTLPSRNVEVTHARRRS